MARHSPAAAALAIVDAAGRQVNHLRHLFSICAWSGPCVEAHVGHEAGDGTAPTGASCEHAHPVGGRATAAN
jgi:hypothetical protein